MLTEEEEKLVVKEQVTIDEPSTEGPLDEEQLSSIAEETKLQEKYGDSPVRAFLESAASSASWGLTDQAVARLGPEFKEALRERRKRHEAASLTGEVTGIVAPALFSGGSTLFAKGMGLAGKGVATASKVGKSVEKLTTKGLNKILVGTGNKKFAKEVLKKSIAKGAGSAVEGTLYGFGKLISEDALGNADFNAENLMAYGGQGALWGGLIGGVMGAAPILYKKGAEVVVPKIKNNKIVDYTVTKIDNFKEEFISPVYNSMKMGGFKHTEILDAMDNQPNIANNIPKVLDKVFQKEGLSSLSSNSKLYRGVKKYIKNLGEGINKTLSEIDEVTVDKQVFPTKSQVASKTIKKLQDMRKFFEKPGKAPLNVDAKAKIKYINDEIEMIAGDILDNTPYTASQLQALKKQYNKMSGYDKTGVLTIKQETNREMGKALRENILELSHKVDEGLGSQLRDQLLDYGTLSMFVGKFGERINGQTSTFFDRAVEIFLSSFMGNLYKYGSIAQTAVKAIINSDLKNKAAVLTGIEKANHNVQGKVRRSVAKYMKKGVFDSPVPIASKLLIDSPLARKRDGEVPKEKPKNDQEAMKNLSDNFRALKENPTYFRNLTSNINFQVAAPETYNKSQVVLKKALGFLGSKLSLPMATNTEVNPFFKKPYPISDQEIYKFKKYLQAIQNPLSLLAELKSGTLSRETVEAVRYVYPNLFEEVQLQVLNNLQDVSEEGKIEYVQRLQLGILMNMPTDMALLPQALKKLQSFYKEAQESQAGGAIAEKKGGPKKGISASAAKQLDIPESRATELERISNRRDLGRT